MANVQIFLSAVSAEFSSYRDALRRDLAGPNMTAKVQEDFIATGTETLDMLDRYIKQCDAVIHLVGDMTGALAKAPSVAAIRERYPDLAQRLPPLSSFLQPDGQALPYTQWEAWLTLYHRKPLIICVPLEGAPRDTRYRLDPEEREAQEAHLKRLEAFERYSAFSFANADRIAVEVLRSLLDALTEAAALVAPGALDALVVAKNRASVWDIVSTASAENLATSRGLLDKIDDRFYVERGLEQDLDSFLRSDKSAMVIVGLSGMGKTTLVARFVNSVARSGHPAFLVRSAIIPTLDSVPDNLVTELTSARQLPAGVELSDFWPLIDAACRTRSKSLVVAIDAVNEFAPTDGGQGSPVQFLLRIGKFALLARARFPSLKLIITSRPETWRRGLEQDRIQIRDTNGAYFTQPESLAYELGRFSSEEAQAAYEKYAHPDAFDIRTPSSRLSPLTRHLLQDPLLLKIACEVYQHRTLPDEFDIRGLFDAYRTQVVERCKSPSAARSLLGEVVEQLMEKDVIRRDSFDVTPDLRRKNDNLWSEFSGDPTTTGSELCDLNVFRRETTAQAFDHVRFAYDRFAQYLFSEVLLHRIRAPQEKARETGAAADLGQAALAIICANLDSAQRLPTVFIALQLTLRELRKDEGVARQFPELLRQLATTGERGLELAVSVLVRLTITPHVRGEDGTAVLCSVLDSAVAETDRPRRKPVVTLGGVRGDVFPVVETVYRMLIDDEYRAWLDSQEQAVRRDHLDVLYGYMRWGLIHPEEEISGAAVQYLFFLWRNTWGLDHAHAILSSVTATIQLPSLLWRPGPRRGLVCVAGMVCLVVAECKGERVTRMLALAETLVHRLGLSRPTVGYLVRNVVRRSIQKRLLEDTIRDLPYPVNGGSFKQAFAVASVRDQAQSAVELLSRDVPWDESAWATTRELSASANGLVLQMLTFAVSTAYERLEDPLHRSSHLALLAQLFDWDRAPCGSEYFAALALYHVNCFGQHATQDALALMGRMAGVMLEKGKGRFTLGEHDYSTNIIGTYGRSLRRYGASFGGCAGGMSARPALEYAIDALSHAKQVGDLPYYQFVCDDIGLLGVLSEPQQVFEVISRVLRDLKGDAEPEHGPGFPSEWALAIRESVLQSLANIRAIYRAEVDRYLLDVVGDAAMHSDVAQRRPRFDRATMFSWTSERLIFRLLTEYRQEIGVDVIDAFRAALAQGAPPRGLGAAVDRLLSGIRRLVDRSA